MKKYECEPCGYIYDPAEGDPDGGIAPGTAFEDIPDTWVCPLCRSPRNQIIGLIIIHQIAASLLACGRPWPHEWEGPTSVAKWEG